MRADLQMADHCERVFSTAEDKLRQLVTAHPDYLPQYTRAGKWMHDGAPWTNWCQGFLPGQLWLLYLYSGDENWRVKAQHYCELIEARKDDRETHDLGFLFWHSWKRWHDLDGGARQHEVVIKAGQTMGLRYKEKGRYLSSFVAPESAFIDIMMNVGIMFYAARETDDAVLYSSALQNCLTSRRYLVRGDGSAVHEGIFDLDTGAFLRESTHQGWRHDSSWARGLSWAIYGFSTAYAFTQDPRFLQTACHCADYYILNSPAHGICPNDWLEPNPARPFEASAAAITSSGLQDLADLVGDPLRARFYRDYAGRIIESLAAPAFLASDDSEWEGLLKQAAYHERLGLGVDESTMFGDYFFLESAAKLLKLI
ncbi:MAG: glycoside hydrolase family 88 protein [Chloroflexi bacterium]|nr:glycoside hydrolase family 88 protein [Chloroflexota bacterium]